MLSFTLLRRKAIGYFVVATLIPVLYCVMTSMTATRRQARP
jgi:hypothetical protein